MEQNSHLLAVPRHQVRLIWRAQCWLALQTELRGFKRSQKYPTNCKVLITNVVNHLKLNDLFIQVHGTFVEENKNSHFLLSFCLTKETKILDFVSFY